MCHSTDPTFWNSTSAPHSGILQGVANPGLILGLKLENTSVELIFSVKIERNERVLGESAAMSFIGLWIAMHF